MNRSFVLVVPIFGIVLFSMLLAFSPSTTSENVATVELGRRASSTASPSLTKANTPTITAVTPGTPTSTITPTATPTNTLTPTPTPTERICVTGTPPPSSYIRDVYYDSPADALTATITLKGSIYTPIRVQDENATYTAKNLDFNTAEVEVVLNPDSVNIFIIVAYNGSASSECEPATSSWETLRQIEVVHGTSSGPAIPEATQTPTPTAEPVIVYPELRRIEPSPVMAGQDLEITGSGGYLFYPPSGYDESARSFDLFMNDDLVSTIGCYVNYCQARITIPSTLDSGFHQISVEGGSTITVEVSSEITILIPVVLIEP